MNENRDSLFEEFIAEWPEMFKDVRCGFYLPEGWIHIVWTLCQEIECESRLNTNEDMKPVVVSQVKSKFGGLRFYYEGGNNDIHCYVRMAESLSIKTCGRCGFTSRERVSTEHFGSLNCLQQTENSV